MYITVDVETLGSSLDDDIIAIGFLKGDNESEESSRLFLLPFDETKVEERCKREMELKCPGFPNQFKGSEYKTQAEAWADIRDYIDCFPTDATFVSDNPAFDIARIDYNLKKYTDRPPMRWAVKYIEISDGTLICEAVRYRFICDPSERMEMCPWWFQYSFNRAYGYLHDHNPVNDARFIYLQQIYTDRYRKSRVPLFSFFNLWGQAWTHYLIRK